MPYTAKTIIWALHRRKITAIACLTTLIIFGRFYLEYPIYLDTAAYKLDKAINATSSLSAIDVHLDEAKDDGIYTANLLKSTPVNINNLSMDVSAFTTLEGNVNQCDVIHVATFISSLTNTFELMNFLKSILTSRRNPLKLHIIVEDSSIKLALLEMFNSWQVAEVGFFYEIKTFSDRVPSFASSNMSERWKILIPAIFNDNDVEKVIVANVNMQIIGDIAVVWNKLSEMQRIGSHFGLVEHFQSQTSVKNDISMVRFFFYSCMHDLR